MWQIRRERARRSVYIALLRLNPETLLQAFDQPEMAVNCTRRSVSTVATQALTLLNSDPMVAAADAFAERVLTEGADDPLGYAVQVAFARETSTEERELLSQFFSEQMSRHLTEAGTR